MAYGNPDSGDAMDDLYRGTEGGDKPETIDQENEEEMADQTTVPLKILSPHGDPVHEGDEVVVKVTGVHGDQATIMYAPHKAGEEDEGGKGEKEPSGEEMSPDEELEQMGKMY